MTPVCRLHPVWLPLLLALSLPPSVPADRGADAQTAPEPVTDGRTEGTADAVRTTDPLREGNRLFRRGDPAGAVDAYRAAGPEALREDPVLAYNLGTALHRLGRLPEAVVWYRRARRLPGHDPWLESNLERARATLAAPHLPPPTLLRPFLLHPGLLQTAAVLASWAALILAARSIRGGFPVGPRAAFVLLIAGAALWSAQAAIEAFGPRPAVLTEPCDHSLPAGSEVWASPAGPGPDAPWTVYGADEPRRCAREALTPL